MQRSRLFFTFSGIVSIDEINEANGQVQGHQKFDFLNADLSTVDAEDALIPAYTDVAALTSRQSCS